MNIRPLRIDLKLGGLMVVPDLAPVMLDSTLLSLASQGKKLAQITAGLLPLQSHIADPSDVHKHYIADPSDVFNHPTNGPWHWLASSFDVTYCGPGTARFLFRNARPTDMLAHANEHSASRVYLDRGITRTVKTRIQLRQATHASAWCMGDADKIRALLDDLCHLGAMGHHGYGQVNGITITEDPQAIKKCWLRPIPTPTLADPYADERIPVQGQSQPPYWNRKSQLAYWPTSLL